MASDISDALQLRMPARGLRYYSCNAAGKLKIVVEDKKIVTDVYTTTRERLLQYVPDVRRTAFGSH